jgi:hypothetical protein
VRFNPHRRARGVLAPDLTGQVVGLCVVDSLAPAVDSSQRWRVRCNAITPERDQCGVTFYMTTTHVRQYQQPGNELFCCAACRSRRRQAMNLVRFSCEGCRATCEMTRTKYEARPEQVKRLCGHCASCAARTRAAGTRLTQYAARRSA